jgi:hypothetical protein
LGPKKGVFLGAWKHYRLPEKQFSKQKGAVINCTFGCFDINQHYTMYLYPKCALLKTWVLYQKQKGAVINCTFGCFDINQHYIKATD